MDNEWVTIQSREQPPDVGEPGSPEGGALLRRRPRGWAGPCARTEAARRWRTSSGCYASSRTSGRSSLHGTARKPSRAMAARRTARMPRWLGRSVSSCTSRKAARSWKSAAPRTLPRDRVQHRFIEKHRERFRIRSMWRVLYGRKRTRARTGSADRPPPGSRSRARCFGSGGRLDRLPLNVGVGPVYVAGRARKDGRNRMREGVRSAISTAKCCAGRLPAQEDNGYASLPSVAGLVGG